VQPADQYSQAGWSLTTSVPATAGAAAELVVYAHSEASGAEGTTAIPLAAASQAPAAASQTTQAPANSNQGSCDFITPFQPGLFSNSTRIDNQWLPLVPGTEFTFQGRANRGAGLLPHTVVLTVTDLSKTIAGVRTVVLWDRDIQDGELSEAELAFHAQDTAGNVWVLGEYPEEYDNGQFAGAPKTWITGQADAQGGLAVMGQPALGTPAYLQGRVSSIEFLDCARVSAMDQSVCVPAGCFDNVLVTDETSPLASTEAHQQKFYAPTVGNIQITASDDPEGETLVLAKVAKLDAEGLAEARTEALKLEGRAYQVSEVYRATAPATP
jgi:hypothetical protein